MHCNVSHIGVYRHAQKAEQTVGSYWLSFLVSGQVHSRIVMPCGREEIATFPKPRLVLTPPGTYADFEFNAQRENWVVMLDTDDMRYINATGQMELRFDGTWIPVRRLVSVQREWVPRWRREFQGMLDAFRSSLPRDRLHLVLSVYNVIRYMLEPQPHGLAETPAQDLRRRIEADARSERSLEELSQECGYSSDHLRELFESEFRVSPAAYRQQARMARAMDLIATSRMSVKEIAQLLGFQHASHFSKSFRKSYGLLPRAAIARFRHQA
jgi:AraC-like DNA-binding protein